MTAAADGWRQAERSRGSAATSAACLECGGAAYMTPSVATREVSRLGCLTASCPTNLSGEGRRSGRQSAATAAAHAAQTPALASTMPFAAMAWPEPGETHPQPSRPAPRRPIRTAQPPTSVAGDPAAVRRELLSWARDLGIAGGLDHDEDDPLGADGETELARRLRGDVRARASETLDLGRLRTSLGWAAEFKADTRREPLFKPLRWEGDLPALRYNQTTLDTLAEYIRQRGSKKRGARTGDAVSGDAIQSYVGVVRILCGAEAGYAVTSKTVNVTAPAAFKRMRQVDGPAGERVLQRGMRASMLLQLAVQGYDRSSARGLMRWAVALLSHNLLLRGGEPGVVDGATFDTSRDLTLGSIEFKPPGPESDGLPWMTVDLVSIKDVGARFQKCVLPVRRRGSGGALGDDPMCTYDAVVLAMRQRLGRLPQATGRVEGPDAIRPLFSRPPRRGQPEAWRTADTNKLAKDMAATLGLPEADFGAKSFRIAGATDLAAVFGIEKAERIIKQRGRWQSDVQRIYERALATEHLNASAAIGAAAGRELEALCPGWVQPATFR